MKLQGILVGSSFVSLSAVIGSSLACTMQLPEPEPEDPPHEVECVRAGVAPDGNLQYLVSIEITLMPPPETTTCMCGVNVGTGTVPPSFKVNNVTIAVANEFSGDASPIGAFDDFAESPEVEKGLAGDDNALENTDSTGFETDVDPFEPPQLEPGDQEKMFFLVEVAKSEYGQLNGQPVQFGAGSDLPSHPLTIFTGYQTTLNLPAPIDGDVNFDGVVNGSDLGLLLGSWGPCATDCLADVNNSGTVDGADLGLLLAAWTG